MESPMLSQAEAAKICNVSIATIRRYRRIGKIKGVKNDPTSKGFLIPLSALIEANLLPPVTPINTPSDTHEKLRAEIEELKTKLIYAQHRAELAEALAEEREKALIAERQALKVLTTGREIKESKDDTEPKQLKKKTSFFSWFNR